MHRAAIALGCVLFASSCSSSISSPLVAPTESPIVGNLAFDAYIRFQNESHHAVWVTNYWSRPLFPWYHYDHACVAPGSDWNSHIGFDLSGPRIEIRYLAEVTANLDCSHPVVATLQTENKDVDGDGGPTDDTAHLIVRIGEGGGRYEMTPPCQNNRDPRSCGGVAVYPPVLARLRP